MKPIVRFPLIAVFVGALASPAPPPPPIPQAVSPWVSVLAHGASIDPAVDSTAAIESAFVRAGQLAARPATSGAPPTAVVKFPAGGYQVSRPLFVPDGVEVWGDGWCSRLEMGNVKRYPALIYGVADPQTVPADRPDLVGVLDTTAAPRAGVRWGWSTHGGRTLQGQFTSANIGPWIDGARTYWDGAECFTLDVALVPPQGGWAPNTPLLGCGRSVTVNDPQPWTLWVGPTGYLVLNLATNPGRVGLACLPARTAIIRVAFQVSLKDGTAAAWVNGTQVDLIVDGLVPGMQLKANSVYPFHVGRQGFAVATSSDPPTPLTLAGLRLGTALRYKPGGVGTNQLTLDGTPATDAYRYFDRTDQRTTVGYLPLDDPPGQRWLRWTPGDGLDELLLVMRGSQGGGKPASLRDLSVWSRGPAVLLGAVLDWRGTNLRLQSETAAAVGSVPIVMSYPITLRDCTLSGGDAAVSLSQAIVALRDCKIEGQGRDGIRLRGASLDASNLFASFCPPQGRSFLRYLAGGEGDSVIRLDRAVIDYEDRGPIEALIVSEAEPQHPTSLRITDLSAGLTGPDASQPRPIVVLTPTTSGAARCVVDGVASGATTGVVAGGQGWRVITVTPATPLPSDPRTAAQAPR